jgi:hypothetical protein
MATAKGRVRRQTTALVQACNGDARKFGHVHRDIDLRTPVPATNRG